MVVKISNNINYNRNINEFKRRITNQNDDKFNNTQKFNKSTSESFATRLTQASF